MIKFYNDFNDDPTDEVPSIMPIITEIKDAPEEEEDMSELETENIPILALRNMVLFPSIAMPVAVGREKSLALIRDAQKRKIPIGVVCQVNPHDEDPDFDKLYKIGVVADIVKILELPDNSTNVILQGRSRFELLSINGNEPYLTGTICNSSDQLPQKKDKEFDALIAALRDITFDILANLGEESKEMIFAVKNIESPNYLINFLATNTPIDPAKKQKLLQEPSIKRRASKLYALLSKEAQFVELKADIQSKTRDVLTQQQKEHFLQQQIRSIQDELGGSTQEQEVDELRERALEKVWSVDVQATFEKELRKLERLHPQSPDYSVQFNYLDQLLNLPWCEYKDESFNLNKVEKSLNKDHYGLEKVKERILEHLAVLKLRNDMKAPIICLYGPPGVGKTSLGKSVANALNRDYARISLGGLHDEAEIRGHRRTYIGAMPGRIIQELIKMGSSNPVFVLDEVDKLGKDFKGDPASALLEVLDPEQNSTFHDNYIDIDYDLSKILFIATANTLSTLSQPLLDRMELINISGYIIEEKIEIARKHLVPKQLEANGFTAKELNFPKPTLSLLISSYTSESGVRQLDKKIAAILRKVARLKASDKSFSATVTTDDVQKYLGAPTYTKDKYECNDYAGVVTGLAWTSVGGEILFVESSLSKGKAGKLTLTGNLGDVMKESAVLALEYIKSHAEDFNLTNEVFENNNIHIHVPEGAIPKDGPSAGVTMVTSLVSSFTKRKVKSHLAMTGEITLRGKVLPVGGIKEKILAAKRAGIKEIILCIDNKKDIDEISDKYLKGLQFHYVREIKDVIKIALTDELVN
ncbi:MAG: endopeptidase La [Bacteroidales bacterium]